MEQQFNSAKVEAKACFGDDSMYMEKLIINPKHIEFQILGDSFGSIIHLCERDCSLQRRGQKMLEESPCFSISDELREKMGKDAIKAAKAVNYQSAGTIEFILDKDNNYYFIEMNTRVQVEHPVTEMLTGIDIITEQLRVASNLPLSVNEVTYDGYAMECRINAEDTINNFKPSAGKVNFVHFPSGYETRVDTALYSGCEVSPFYDSMIAKIIVKGKTRLEVIKRMRRALEEMIVDGIDTNISLIHMLMYNKDIIRGDYDTGFIDEKISDIINMYKEVKVVSDDTI